MIDVEETPHGLIITVQRGTIRSIVAMALIMGLLMVVTVLGFLYSQSGDIIFLVVGGLLIVSELVALIVVMRFMADWVHTFDNQEGVLTSVGQSIGPPSERRLELSRIVGAAVMQNRSNKGAVTYSVSLQIDDQQPYPLPGIHTSSHDEANALAARIRAALNLPAEVQP